MDEAFLLPVGQAEPWGVGTPGALAWGGSECTPRPRQLSVHRGRNRARQDHQKEHEIHTTRDSEVPGDASQRAHPSRLQGVCVRT